MPLMIAVFAPITLAFLGVLMFAAVSLLVGMPHARRMAQDRRDALDAYDNYVRESDAEEPPLKG